MDSIPGSTSAAAPIELIFLGTGTSSSVPHVDCLTAPPDAIPCVTCLSTFKPEGKKNIRRNTSVALRILKKDGSKATVVIDVGKNFQAAAVEWFPKYGLRQIDAVIITHAHADAMNGLDDLRVWTLSNAIQPHIDVYVSQATFREVQRAFPYLVAKEFASGGGDVPEFEWHIIEDKIPFEIRDTGIQITPFSVHHGRLFSTDTPPAFTPTPCVTQPTSPNISGRSSPARQPQLTVNGSKVAAKIHPYTCLGFTIQDSIIYMSDVSYIPDEAWATIETGKNPKAVLVIDCLRLHAHTSHMGVREALEAIRRVGANRNYFIGFSHDVTHDEYVTIGEAAGREEPIDTANMSSNVRRGVAMVKDGKRAWLRPSHDGLRVFVSSDDSVWDETYD
ncbi:beta-lactamase-like protein [Hygrophoropsis aurantiaca]|uniref:Beta-lactamase-like protein n=1 Tax=Hygrophoropsis aurantiaca TaxID=72124 RepID=A0ACB8ANK8_9AGAM|nr:beta-lactamase-like protein [Hygrophoropsis aurantiaca]